jgi:hypothetical protein
MENLKNKNRFILGHSMGDAAGDSICGNAMAKQNS